MNNIQKRILLFLVGCIGVRTLFVIIANKINKDYLPFMGVIALFISIGFAYIFLTNSRQTGPEVFGDKIWWNKLRPIHAINYGLFAYLAITKSSNAWMILLFDVFVGLTAHLYYHYSEGHI